MADRRLPAGRGHVGSNRAGAAALGTDRPCAAWRVLGAAGDSCARVAARAAGLGAAAAVGDGMATRGPDRRTTWWTGRMAPDPVR